MTNYYTYAYLREDGTPYYIGKGKNHRLYDKRHTVGVPKKERVLILKNNLTEEEAFRHEVYMISILGRKDLGTGILRNKTNGGEGTSGRRLNDDHKNALFEGRKNYIFTEEIKNKIRDTLKRKNIKPPSRLGIKLTKEQIELRCKYNYIFTSPNGRQYQSNNLKQFCRDNGLNAGCLHSVITGKYKQHKGWTARIVSHSS
jgi:hypothetical protein